jgi:hypothetical protein
MTFSQFSFARPLVIKTSSIHHTKEVKRTAIELRKAGVFLSTIRAQLKLSEGDGQALNLEDG